LRANARTGRTSQQGVGTGRSLGVRGERPARGVKRRALRKPNLAKGTVPARRSRAPGTAKNSRPRLFLKRAHPARPETFQ
jgi:hypothetical protein